MINPQMFNKTSGYSNPQNNVDVDLSDISLEYLFSDDPMVEDKIALDNIVFTLMCKGETKLAKKFTRNYLKNFKSVYGGIYEE